jgi:hypothetical protein
MLTPDFLQFPTLAMDFRFFSSGRYACKEKMRTYFLPNDLASVRFCQILAYAMLKTLVEQRESNKMKRTINFVITPEQLY